MTDSNTNRTTTLTPLQAALIKYDAANKNDSTRFEVVGSPPLFSTTRGTKRSRDDEEGLSPSGEGLSPSEDITPKDALAICETMSNVITELPPLKPVTNLAANENENQICSSLELQTANEEITSSSEEPIREQTAEERMDEEEGHSPSEDYGSYDSKEEEEEDVLGSLEEEEEDEEEEEEENDDDYVQPEEEERFADLLQYLERFNGEDIDENGSVPMVTETQRVIAQWLERTKPAPISSLPMELLTGIIDYLPTNDQYACKLVSSYWNKVSSVHEPTEHIITRISSVPLVYERTDHGTGSKIPLITLGMDIVRWTASVTEFSDSITKVTVDLSALKLLTLDDKELWMTLCSTLFEDISCHKKVRCLGFTSNADVTVTINNIDMAIASIASDGDWRKLRAIDLSGLHSLRNNVSGTILSRLGKLAKRTYVRTVTFPGLLQLDRRTFSCLKDFRTLQADSMVCCWVPEWVEFGGNWNSKDNLDKRDKRLSLICNKMLCKCGLKAEYIPSGIDGYPGMYSVKHFFNAGDFTTCSGRCVDGLMNSSYWNVESLVFKATVFPPLVTSEDEPIFEEIYTMVSCSEWYHAEFQRSEIRKGRYRELRTPVDCVDVAVLLTRHSKEVIEASLESRVIKVYD